MEVERVEVERVDVEEREEREEGGGGGRKEGCVLGLGGSVFGDVVQHGVVFVVDKVVIHERVSSHFE